MKFTRDFQSLYIAGSGNRGYNTLMENTSVKKRGIAAIFALCPVAHTLSLVSAAVIALQLLLRRNYRLMNTLSVKVIRPLHQSMAELTSKLGAVSLAEILIGLFSAAALLYIVSETVRLIRSPGRLQRLYRLVMRLLAAGLTVYAGFCLLWGVYYYGDDFLSKSGLKNEAISVEQLETVTVYFADMLNEYSVQTSRDENGYYCTDRADILRRSPEVFAAAEEMFPCLKGPAVSAKAVHFSRVMSYLDFTGFFFPFTAEANVNMDYPPGHFAATVAHELSHQRGVAKEQEANFTAVLACPEYGDTDYVYSACMLAYTYLGNALHSADYGKWLMVYQGLEENVLKDMQRNRDYWQQFDTAVQSVSTTVYEGFLQSYDQTLGMKSYGACVDLLVNYYYAAAAEHYGTA